jgi:16S rRNA G966 N2-methylase RsmD
VYGVVSGISELLINGWRVEAGRRLLPYDLFKWWGRRPTLVVDALLLDAVGFDNEGAKTVVEDRLRYRSLDVLKGLTVCDPMCGGGTTAIEALLLGADKIICSDIDPASSIVVKAMVSAIRSCDEAFSVLLSAAKRVYSELKDLWCIDSYCYVHAFLTRRCNEEYCYAPKWLGAFRVRNSLVKIAISGDGELYEDSNVGVRDFVKLPKSKLVEVTKGVYAYAAELYKVDDDVERYFVSLVKDEYIAEHLNRVQGEAKKLLPNICTPIIDGKETRRLFKEGVTCWEQIFTPRQLITLLRFLEIMKQEHREFLDIAVALVGTVIRTSSMLAFYYQPYAKVNPGLVVKSFWLPPYPVELNPVAGDIRKVKTIGRGTLITYLHKLRTMCSKIRDLHSVASKEVVIEVQDALNMNYINCDIIVLDPPYPGKIAYNEVTQVYTILFGLLREVIPRSNGSSINIYNVDSYTNTLEKLITKIFTEAPKAVVYLLMSNDNKGSTVVNKLTEKLKQVGIAIEKLGTVIGEAPGALGRGKSREIMILRIKRNKILIKNH